MNDVYVGRTIKQLETVPLEQWTLDELSYHLDTLNRFEEYLNDNGANIRQMVEDEIESRGGLPFYGGDYDHPTTVRYD